MALLNKFNTKGIRLLQVLPHLGSGGLVSGAIEIANYVQSKGGLCVVLSSGGYREKDLRRTKCQLEFLPVDSKNPITILKNKKKILEIVNKYKINIIHARSRAPAWSCYLASKKINIAFVTTFHGTYGLENFFKKKYNSVMLKSDAVIAISEFIKQHINQKYNRHKNIFVIPRGVDEKIFSPRRVSQQRVVNLAKKLRIAEFRYNILMPGRLTEWKGHRYAIRALALLKEKNVSLMIVGDKQNRTNYKMSLQKLAISLNVQDKVLFIDNTRDMPAYLMLADLVLSCSTKPEAFGRVILETQAMGKPIIAFSHGGAVELIKTNHNGILSPVKDITKLSNNISKVLNLSLQERRKLSNKSISKVKKNYLTKYMCQNTVNVYRKLVVFDKKNK